MSKKHKSKKFKPGKSRKSKSAEQQLKETSTQDLIISMNYTLSILQARGVRILNWDDKGKETTMNREQVQQVIFSGKANWKNGYMLRSVKLKK